MVVEWLTFEVAPEERDAWLVAEEHNWSRFLETQPGFIGKEMWVEDGNTKRVHAVIRWESMDAWNAVSPDDIAAVDAAMGQHSREPTMRAFRRIRNC